MCPLRMCNCEKAFLIKSKMADGVQTGNLDIFGIVWLVGRKILALNISAVVYDVVDWTEVFTSLLCTDCHWLQSRLEESTS